MRAFRRGTGLDAGRLVFFAWTAAAFAFLFLPIVTIIVYSFNGGRNLYIWTEFSPRWYGEALGNERALDALSVSIRTALCSTALALVFGVLAGIALARRKGAWTAPYLGLLFVILGTPELVSAIGQMIWLDRLGLYGGLTRISFGHSLFNAAVVTLIVRARAEGLGETLEQAAADLGARPWRAFLDVTLPLMFPAVLAGALLSFTFSFDDVIISLFVQRPGSSTFPLYILSSFRTGLRGDVAALAAMVLVASILAIVLAGRLLARGERPGALGGLVG